MGEPAKLDLQEKEDFVRALDDVSISSDAFFPFRDSIDHATKLGVKFVAQPGGSVADDEVVAACDQYGILWHILELASSTIKFIWRWMASMRVTCCRSFL